MGRSSARAYVEPIAALAAVFAVVVGLAVYTGAVGEFLGRNDRPVAETVLEEFVREARTDGVVDPERLAGLQAPTGWRVNVTLATPTDRWTRGPTPPDSADRARREVAVRLAPGSIRPGRLTVVAWR